MSLDEEKRRLRDSARRRRRAIAAEAVAAGDGLADRFLEASDRILGGRRDPIVSAYWPLPDEMDTRALIGRLQDLGYTCCLPVVAQPNAPLVFRRWRRDEPMEDGLFDTRHPAADAPELTPDVLLVPMLAFDADGYRLGYGGGYYDRTLAGLRSRATPVAVGIAYAGQRVDRVPRDELDEPLDWVVTESGVIEIGDAP
jgi:5-formyltetrahydrofolate cyclo-ligase